MTHTPGHFVALSDVAMVYPGPTRRSPPILALRGVTVDLTGGMVHGLVGENGAGKTTLLEICVGALRPSRGVVRWFGADNWTERTRRRVAVCADVPAFPRLLKGAEVLEISAGLKGLARDDGRREIARLSERLDLGAILGQRVTTLSRGNLVRLGLAQAMLGTPDVLLCDESFGPLDPAAQANLRIVLREEAKRGVAVLISSHQLDQVERVADEVLILRKGVIVQRLSADQITTRWLLVLDVAELLPLQRAAVQAHFPGSETEGTILSVPWPEDRVDAEAVLASLPPGCESARVVTVRRHSLESVFLETS